MVILNSVRTNYGLRYYYCPLVCARDTVWPLRLPIVCHVAQSRVIQSHLDHHTLARLRLLQCPVSIRLFDSLLLLLLSSMPPLEVVFRLPLFAVVVVSIVVSKGPIPSPAFVGRHDRSARWREADAGLLHPLSANTLHHPWKYCFPTPPPALTLVELVGLDGYGGTTPRLLWARHSLLCAG